MVIIKILLLDQHEKYVRNLKKVIDFRHTEEINGENISDLILSGNQDIQKDYRTLYKDDFGFWHEFIVKGIDEIKDHSGITKEVFSESSFYETLGDYIEEKAPQGSANHALQVALEPTRWQVGFVDDLGINRTHFYNISAKEAVEKVAEVWGGEIRTRVEVQGNVVTGRYVDLFQRRGSNNGKRFTYKKDINTIERTIHREDVITALYGFGKGEEVGEGFGRRINFADINNGKKYLENNEARQRWGRLDENGNRVHVFDKVEYDDVEDKELLKDLTQKDLDHLSEPKVSYRANVIDLKAYGYEHEGTQLGDYVLVIDKDFEPELRVLARVVRLVRTPKKPEETDITIGNFIDDITKIWKEQEDIINNFRGKQGIWDRSENLNPDGTVDANRINDIIRELNEQINADGGYVYFDDDGDGMITFDKPRDQDPTKVIQIKGGSLRIANTKKSDGSWDWRTVATGDGFTADAIVAGNLELTRGLKITNDGKPILSIDSSGKVIFDVAGVVKEQDLQDAIDEIELQPGKDGVSVISINNMYYLSVAPDYLAGGQWRETPPAMEEDMYMWSKQVTTLSNEDTIETDPIMISGYGKQGRSVKEITEQYAFSEDKEEVPTEDAWTNSLADWEEGLYVWTRSKIEFTSEPLIEYTEPIVNTVWEKLDEKIDKKADGDYVDEIDTRVTEAESMTEIHDDEIKSLFETIQEHYDRIENNEVTAQEAAEDVSRALSRNAIIEENLGEYAKDLNFLENQIRYTDEGILLRHIDKDTGETGGVHLKISRNSIDFMDGDNRVAFMSDNVLQINHGIFVESARIGEHLIETIDGHTVWTWVP